MVTIFTNKVEFWMEVVEKGWLEPDIQRYLVWKIEKRKNSHIRTFWQSFVNYFMQWFPPPIFHTVEGLYLEYNSVCPLVRIGSPSPLSRKRVCPPRYQRGGNTRLRVRGWREPSLTTGAKASWHSCYSVFHTVIQYWHLPDSDVAPILFITGMC